MKTSTALTVAVIAVVVCLGFNYLTNYEVDNTEDYTLLASSDLNEGLTIELVAGGHTEMEKTTVVTKVSGSDVTVNIDAEESYMTSFSLYYFSPDVYLPIDYTDPSAIPEGVTVYVEGDLYIIDGSFEQRPGQIFAFNDLWITYDGDEVLDVDGSYQLKVEVDRAGTQVHMVTTEEVWTEDGEAQVKVTAAMEATGTVDKDVALATALEVFDEDIYHDCSKKVTNGKLGGLNVKIYTLNGENYRDYKLYVYNGYVLKAKGTIVYDGIEYEQYLDTKVYMQLL
ncbi:MAG: hypothetical protein J5920_03750 [Candidatus Methanomethylophilaceae archaeon]|nr:hypothetical protein [Candidatus Methanomethylophilaceae archaeon]